MFLHVYQAHIQMSPGETLHKRNFMGTQALKN